MTNSAFERFDNVEWETVFVDFVNRRFNIYTGYTKPGYEGAGRLGAFPVPMIDLPHPEIVEIEKIMTACTDARQYRDAAV